MPDKPYKTKCPNCQVQFRLSAVQLQAAKGAVRCGSCLKVFKADQHLTETTPPTKKIPQQANPVPQPKAQIKKLAPKQKTTPISKSGLVGTKRDAEGNKLNSKGISADDEDWASQLLEEMGEIQEETEKKPPPAQSAITPMTSLGEADLSDDFLGGDLSDDVFDSGFGGDYIAEQSSPNAPGTSDDESWARSMLEDIENEGAVDTDNIDAEELDLSDEVIDDDAYSPFSRGASKDSDPDEGFFGGEDDFDFLEDENSKRQKILEHSLNTSKRSIPVKSFLGWALLCLLASASLIGQHAYFNFEQLARDSNFRPLYAQVCPHIKCELPTLSDISQIRGANLVVRTHPSTPGALIIDAIVYNGASFEQPFPLLEITFSNTQEQLIASRKFSPGEYLAGELRDVKNMPANTPIRLSLEIIDPGKQAVNYAINFYENKKNS